MDQNTLRSPDPSLQPPHGERRRSVRQKPHTPVYASFNGGQTGTVVDLSELLDLDESGFAVQTSGPLKVDRALSLCLDLTETRGYVHGGGQVVWSDDTGRAGVRFSYLPDPSRKVLKEWLFTNLLVASTNHQARAEQIERHQLQEPPAPQLLPGDDHPSPSLPAPAPSLERAALFSALDDVRREVHALGNDIDAILNLITNRALTLTGASGAALAFLTDGVMFCRARAGNPAPPFGSPVDVEEGLSGHCIRSGRTVLCQDASTDPRVDSDLCRALSIGSFMAVPIFADFRVVGLLEVFSPHPSSFSEAHSTLLDRLVELVPKKDPEEIKAEIEQTENKDPDSVGSQLATSQALQEALPDHRPQAQPPTSARTSQLKEQPSAERLGLDLEPLLSSRRWPHFTHLVLLCLVIAVVAVVLGYLLAPVIEKHLASRAQSPPPSPQIGLASSAGSPSQSPSQGAASSKPRHLSPQDLRKLADQGDAEAQWSVGVLYQNGEGVPKDDAQAVRWFRRAAEKGYVPALSALGSRYWAGRGVPQDYSRAYFWFQLALAEGDENSKPLLEGLATQMTQAQVNDARQQAEAWLRSHAHPAKPAGN